jgi:hypothetical protein
LGQPIHPVSRVKKSKRENTAQLKLSDTVFPSITNKMQLHIIQLFLLNALHVSGGSSAHHQELKTLHTASSFFKLILLPAMIVEELELHGPMNVK